MRRPGVTTTRSPLVLVLDQPTQPKWSMAACFHTVFILFIHFLAIDGDAWSG
jgi:hypothetical protein